MGRIDRRVEEYERTGRTDAVLGDSVLDEAAELWAAVQPSGAGGVTPTAAERLADACLVLVRLHRHRAGALPDGAAKDVEWARALALLRLGLPDEYPHPLHALLGWHAHPGGRAERAAMLLQHAGTAAYPALRDVAIDLLGAALIPIYRADMANPPSDLDRVITAAAGATAGIPRRHPARAAILTYLGTAYLTRFVRDEAVPDLDEAIHNLELAIAAADPGDPGRPDMLAALSNAYRTRFDHTGDAEDADRAVELGESAVATTPPGDPNHAVRLAAVSTAHDARFQRFGQRRDIDRAIETGERAVAASSPESTDLAAMLSNLSSAYRNRFQLSADLDDLARAIRAGEQAVAATAADSPFRCLRLNNVAAAYGERFEHGGERSDVDRAIELGTEAVACGAGRLAGTTAAANLANSLRERYRWSGASEDLDRAVQAAEQAAAATPVGHSQRGLHLLSLALAYQTRWERNKSAHDLEGAIRAAEQAAAETPHDEPGRARPLSYLSFAYRKRFRSTGDRRELDRAIEAGDQAVAASAPGNPELPSRLCNLGLGCLDRFQLSGAPGDLDRAITLVERAVTTLPDHHPDLAGVLFALGTIYHAGVVDHRHVVGPDTLPALARKVAATTAAPEWRVLAGLSIGWLAHTLDEHEIAVELLDLAVSLLPTVAPRALDWADQEHRLGTHLGLVGEAVAAHCARDDPVGAVQIAELGRGILLGARLESRTDVTELERRHPTLAARFTTLRDELNSGAPQRTNRWAEYDALLTEIRRLPELDRFLMPPRPSETRRMADRGAVLLVNVGTRRGDAVVITADADPVLVPLPHLTMTDVHTYAAALRGDTGVWAGCLRRQRLLPQLLGWLWDTIVGPTLDALPRSSTQDLPRVWWMPTGLLGLLPLHAAGHPNRPGALDRVVSSYTSTLRTLAHGRAQQAATRRRQLSVAVRHAPGLPVLDGTVREAAAPPGALVLTDQQATVDEVLGALRETTWAHFACHASTDVGAPSRSGLVLHDGRLTARAVSQQRLAAAEFAYLSACSTAHRGWQHAEECLHLASAFQLAGFRHVIASLWPLADDIATVAAREFYRHLPATASADRSALAIHRVTRTLRSDHPDRPDLWASLIHSGP